MWKPEHRRAADRRGLRYPSDLTEPEWVLVERSRRPSAAASGYGSPYGAFDAVRRLVPAKPHSWSA